MPGSDPLGGLRGWGRGQNLPFAEYGQVAYQITWNHECRNMQAILYPYTHPPPLGEVKGQNIFFSESSHVSYKMKGMKNGAPCNALTHTLDPCDRVKDKKIESSHDANQIKGNGA